jgi:transcriptional regulator with PAS, ATPase and Fis domain
MDWAKQFSGAITICDLNGIIIYMNDTASAVFDKEGGGNLIGKSLFKCHSSSSNEKIKEIMTSGKPNIYTIEKNGVKKLIHQSPYFEDNRLQGVIELSIEIPFEMPNHIRS